MSVFISGYIASCFINAARRFTDETIGTLLQSSADGAVRVSGRQAGHHGHAGLPRFGWQARVSTGAATSESRWKCTEQRELISRSWGPRGADRC